jgi:predicted metalloprotease with PDZ domain
MAAVTDVSMRHPHYALGLGRAATRYIDVCMTLPPNPQGWRLSLPAWIPGSYLIRDFAKNLVGMQAETSLGEPLAITALDQQTWQLPGVDTETVITYAVYCADFSVRTAHVDSDHAFFNGSSVFLRAHGLEALAHRVTLNLQDAPPAWRVATSMPSDPSVLDGYRAENYEALIDYPFEIGVFELTTFEARDVPHRMVFTHPHPKTDLARIARDVARICAVEIDLFGGAPFEQYLFLVALDGQGFGGLEHRDSTALIFPRDDLPMLGETAVSPAYQRFLSLCAHEYFHSWHVKRIRPAVFENLPLAGPAHTRLLWVFEGFTSYFDDWLVRRAGLVDEAQYQNALAQTITRAVRGKGWSRQTLEESSFYAWTRFYQQDENAVNAIVSYYTRGALVALMLDLTLRRSGRSLEAVMRQLWLDHGRTGLPEGEAIERLIESVAEQSLRDFFHQALRGTAPLDFVSLLAEFGVRAEAVAEPACAVVDFGAVVGGDDPRVARVQVVFEDRPAACAGLAAGDEIIALDEFAINGAGWQKRLDRYRVGDQVRVSGFRQGRLRHWTVTLAAPVLNQWHLTCLPASVQAAARGAAWLAVVDTGTNA